MLHHVTPVARGITDAEQDQLVFFLCPLDGFRAPGVPIHGIVRVLKKVGTSFVDESIWHFSPGLRGERREKSTNAMHAT